MGKRIVAFCAGRKNGNTEVYMKEALMAAEAAGCEVELVRLCECDLQVCRCCKRQVCGIKGKEACPVGNDDAWWMVEKFLDSDGYLFGAPVWSLGPPGNVTVFRDRIMGPKMDPSGYEIFGGEPPCITGRVKVRPGALISVGGAGTEHWTSLGLPTLYTTTFSALTKVIDHMNVTGVADPGAATFYEQWIERARKLGQNLAHAVLHPEEPLHWLGEIEKGVCPGCHLDYVIMKPHSNEVVCQICGHRGTLKIENNQVVDVDWLEYDKDDRLCLEGLKTHGAEVMGIIQNEYLPRKDEIPARMKKYDDYRHVIQTPPSKQQ
jgi:multimeric flavodoxin WrbA